MNLYSQYGQYDMKAAAAAANQATGSGTIAVDVANQNWFKAAIDWLMQLGGKTPHLSWDQANPVATNISTTVNNTFASAYGQSAIDTQLALPIAKALVPFMTTRWGTTSDNPLIGYLNSIIGYGAGKDHDFARVVWAHAMWVLLGTDSSRPNDQATVFANDYQGIFVAWAKQEGFNTDALTGTSTTKPGTAVTALTGQLAGLFTNLSANTLLALLAVGVVVGFAVKHKGRR